MNVYHRQALLQVYKRALPDGGEPRLQEGCVDQERLRCGGVMPAHDVLEHGALCEFLMTVIAGTRGADAPWRGALLGVRQRSAPGWVGKVRPPDSLFCRSVRRGWDDVERC